jgi:hypothetical protein
VVKALLCFVGAFLLSAAINTLLSACTVSDDCDCPTPPQTPAPQGPLPITESSAYDAVGNEDTLSVDPRGGTVELTATQLTIRYEHDGIERGVIYDILPNE